MDQALKASPGRREGVSPRRLLRGRFLILAATVFLACVFAGAALAVNFYYVGTLGPGGYGSSSGWNNRDYNRACEDQSGDPFTYLVAVGYYDTNMNRVFYSGDIWTNCGQGKIARLENNGYFRTRCWNHDVVSFRIVCQTDTG